MKRADDATIALIWVSNLMLAADALLFLLLLLQ